MLCYFIFWLDTFAFAVIYELIRQISRIFFPFNRNNKPLFQNQVRTTGQNHDMILCLYLPKKIVDFLLLLQAAVFKSFYIFFLFVVMGLITKLLYFFYFETPPPLEAIICSNSIRRPFDTNTICATRIFVREQKVRLD